MDEDPEWLPLMSGRIAMWLREAIDSDDLPTMPHNFPIVSQRHGLCMVRIQLVRSS